MKKILMLSTYLATKELIIEAKKRGIYTIVTDYFQPEQSVAKMIADEYWMISTTDTDALIAKCREEQISAIFTGISQFHISVAIQLCEALNLPFYASASAWEYTLNKRKFKDICKMSGVPVAKDYYLGRIPQKDELKNIDFPVVVKAINLSANLGMSYCFCQDELIPACEKARSASQNDSIIIEKMIHGHEYTAYYALADGEASLINFSKMFHQNGYPSNCYSFTTSYTDHLDKYLEEIDPYIKKALSKMGCKEGIAWIEMMLDDDGHFYMLEMGYRLSGDMMALVHKNISNFDSYAWMMDISMGIQHKKTDLPESQTALPDRIGCSYILWSKEAGIVTKIIGFENIIGDHNIKIEDYFIKIGHKVRKHQYLAVITFDVKDYEEMCEVIQKINSEVEIWNEQENIVVYFDDLEALRIENNL